MNCHENSSFSSNSIFYLFRIGLLVHDFKELCLHSAAPHGATILNHRLLKALGYTVFVVPHLEFHVKDKPVAKVQYLGRKLSELRGDVKK